MAIDRILKKRVTSLPKGTIVRGKWHKKTYEIIEKLGEGAIGAVYLCRTNQQLAALKISEKQTSIMLEVNVLKAFDRARGTHLGPVLFDVDDWVQPNGTICSFYVMEYIKGERLDRFVRKNGPRWIGLLMFQLTEKLESLHEAGWIFGDLKLDNLIVRSSPPKVRWVDVGGTTQIGRSIKEYTELYDRGYWGMGSRRAEPSYDLFALAMVFLQIYYPNELSQSRPSKSPEKFLFGKVDNVKELKPYSVVLKRAFTGRYNTSAEMKREIEQILLRMQGKSKNKDGDKEETSTIQEAGWISLLSIFYLIASLIF